MLAVIGVIVMAIALLLTPIGVPGIWIMIAVLAAGAWQGTVSVFVLGVCVVLALVAELAEWVIIEKLNVRYGGSRLAFWGAILGGIGGVMIGLPVPVIGPIIAGFVGTFVGAALATIYETRKIDSTLRVGWGAMIGKLWAAGVKVGAGIVIFVLGSADLLF